MVYPTELDIEIFKLLARYRYLPSDYIHAFVGGSLVPHGGHNPIEPAAAGVPVCFGPSMSNFREIAQAFLAANAAEEVTSAAGVIAFATRMFEDEALQRAWGERAKSTVQQNRGASSRTASRLLELLA